MLPDPPEKMQGWKTPLMGQNSDVEGWVRNPHMIDLKPNLEHLKQMLLPSDSILDVGCHAGYFRDYLSWENYVGIDLFPEHVELARRLPPGVKFYIEDLFDTNKTADVVICSRVLIHIPDFRGAVKKLLQAAKRMLVLILKVGPVDTISEYFAKDGYFWEREFSIDTINEVLGEFHLESFPGYTNIYKYAR